MTQMNTQVVLKKPLQGNPSAEDFALRDVAMPTVKDGDVLVRHIYLSLDPYQRSAMSGRHMSADGPLAENQMPSGGTVGQIVQSRHAAFSEGDYVLHHGGWQAYSVSNGEGMRTLDPAKAPLSTYLGILGMPGLTAYASIIKLAHVQAGQTVLVSAAAGPVGSTIGQIAIQKGARAVGIAGSDEKCRYVTEVFGFDACINYKDAHYLDHLKSALPDGADIYHDNVGGQMLIDAMGCLKDYGTVILCGLISQYNDPSRAVNLPVALPIVKRAVMKGLVVYDFEDHYDDFLDLVAPWVKHETIKYKEDRVDGLEHTGALFAKLMNGQNFGKALVVIDPEEDIHHT